jgi:hypothetical protein
MSTTLADVVNAAGVSITTVSHSFTKGLLPIAGETGPKPQPVTRSVAVEKILLVRSLFLERYHPKTLT